MIRIDSQANSRLKLLGKLRQRKNRKKEGLFIAEGVRLVEMAADSAWKISFALFSDSALEGERAKILAEGLKADGVTAIAVSDAIYGRLTNTESPQGVMAIVENGLLDEGSLSGLELSQNSQLLVLDGVQDPGNAGTIIRTADAAGFDGVICLDGTVDLLNDKAVRSSMGSLFNIPVAAEVSHDAFLAFCLKRGISLYVTALDETACPHFRADYKKKCAIVLGNEGNGVSDTMLKADGQRIYIPMSGSAESLNVAIAGAIVMYEAYRQRG